MVDGNIGGDAGRERWSDAPEGVPAVAGSAGGMGAAPMEGGYAPASGRPATPGYAPAPGYPPMGYGPMGYGPVPAARWNGMAIAGFVCSFFACVVGLVLSIIGLKQVNETGERGRGLAIAGIVIGAVNTVLSVLVVVFVVHVIGVATDEVSYRYAVYDDDYGYYMEQGSPASATGETGRIDGLVAQAYARL